MNNPKLLVILTVALWSFAMFLARLISAKSQFVLISLSFSFTFITFLSYFYYTFRKSFFKKLKSIKIRYLLVGQLGYFTYWLGIIQSFRAFNSASEPTILNYTWPVFTIIFTELLFRKKPKSNTFRIIESIGIIFGFISIVTLATEGNFTTLNLLNLKGLGWGLLAGTSYGLFSSYSSTIPKDEHCIFLLSSIFMSLVLMSCFSISEISLIKTFTIKDVFAVAALGCLVDGMGYITWTKANRLAYERRINISSVASITFALPLLSLTIIAVFLKETQLFQPYFILSLFFLLLSSLLCQKTELFVGWIKNIK